MNGYNNLAFLTVLLCLCGWVSDSYSSEYLSLKFSKKSQIKTIFTWLKYKPDLIASRTKTRSRQTAEDDGVIVTSHMLDGRLPYAAIGKLFFTNINGEISNCSGVFAGEAHIIVTAAHCVMSRHGDWNRDFMFVHAYGSENQDMHVIECLLVPEKWGEYTGDKMLPYDYAFLRTLRATRSGTLKIGEGSPPDQLTIVGYSDSHFNGTQLLEAQTLVTNTNSGNLGSIENPFGRGNSGAPWLNVSTVYSVSSHIKTESAGLMYGPKLTSAAIDLFDYASNGCEVGDNPK